VATGRCVDSEIIQRWRLNARGGGIDFLTSPVDQLSREPVCESRDGRQPVAVNKYTRRSHESREGRSTEVGDSRRRGCRGWFADGETTHVEQETRETGLGQPTPGVQIGDGFTEGRGLPAAESTSVARGGRGSRRPKWPAKGRWSWHQAGGSGPSNPFRRRTSPGR